MIQTPRINKERIEKYLAEGLRFDGRKAEQFRDVEVELGVSKKAEGSARVRLGKTEVIVGVKMSVGEPYPDSQDKGNLIVSAEMLPLSSPRFESGPPKFPVIEFGRVLDRGIRESKFIDFEKLCIIPGEKVWNVFVDVYTINDGGNLLDAAGIAAVIAIKNAEIPKYDEKENKVLFGESSGKKIPTSKNVPLAITVHKIGDHFIVDPTREEEDVSETRVTIGSSDGSISSMQKGEIKSLKIEEFSKALDLAAEVERAVYKQIEKFLK